MMKHLILFHFAFLLVYFPLQAQHEPSLFFREDWKEIPSEFPITQEHVANENLVLKTYGPGGDSLKKSNHDHIPNDPYYVWSGNTNNPWAATLQHQSQLVNLSENAKIKWQSRQSGFHRMHIILKLADGTWLISDQSDGYASQWREREFIVSDIRWRALDIETLHEGGWVEDPDLSRVAEIGFTDLRSGQSSPSSARLDWIEVYGKPVDIMGQSGAAFPALTQDGAWCWFADPRSIYHEGDHRKNYTGWVNQDGDIMVASYNYETQKIKTHTLQENLEYDDHANPALLMRPDNKLMVFYSAHNGDEMYYHIAENPESISGWAKSGTTGVNTEGNSGYTYSNPMQLASENNKIYLFWRGNNWQPNFSTSPDGENWAPAKTMIEGGARPYVKYVSDGDSTIHFAFTDGHPRVEPNNNIYYAYYKAGSFYKANGDKICDMGDLPFEPQDADLLYNAQQQNGRAWIWDIALDKKGHPAIVHTALPGVQDHRYRYAKWTGEKWINNQIVKAGGWFPQTPEGEEESEKHYSGGVVLDHTSPNTVYLSRPVNGIFEIEKWTTFDQGENWESVAVTSGSEKNNIRPVVPRNHPGVEGSLFWMHGDYIHYTNYDTEIKMIK